MLDWRKSGGSFSMIVHLVIFIVAIACLIFAATIFTQSAEKIGLYMKLPSFVVGIFIVGVGTSLPELISGIISVQKGVSEILPGNIMGANISNILLITGVAVVANRKPIQLKSDYLYIDLHFLIGSFLYFYIITQDGIIQFWESAIGIAVYLIYSTYLIKSEIPDKEKNQLEEIHSFPWKSFILLLASAMGIFFGADYTVSSLEQIALAFHVPNSIIALTLLSLGTTLPELTVNISAIRQGKAEMAIGNILGSCVFNTLMIAPISSAFGTINVPQDLLSFSLPVMGACGLFFYLLTQDKKVSVWEGLLLICLYMLFMMKIAGI
ncbi:MAG: sodium:calcium antiporter [Bacteroidia bacterium]|nr:sodium:calcium antiporter [Bacteroidia bacterium]